MDVEITETEFASSPARKLLAEALAAQPARLDLAAIAVARLAYPELDPAEVTGKLDALGARVRGRMVPGAPPAAMITALGSVMSDDGFGGNQSDYDAPENSFIHQVLARRVGLPIALSVIWVEVARRAGIPLYGVGYPGHFLVACDTDREPIVIDPFGGGMILDHAQCLAILERFAPGVEWSPALITPAPVRTIIVRMLTNLKHSYVRRNDSARVLPVIDMLLALMPEHPGELRARAAALTSLGAHRAALRDLDRCLELGAHAPDREVLTASANALRAKLGPLN